MAATTPRMQSFLLQRSSCRLRQQASRNCCPSGLDSFWEIGMTSPYSRSMATMADYGKDRHRQQLNRVDSRPPIFAARQAVHGSTRRRPFSADSTTLKTSLIPTATIVNDGRAIQVSSNDDDSQIVSTFHAPWLWQCDPAFVHPSSGQQTRSISSFYIGGWTIVEGRVVKESPYSSPPPGSLHSTAGTNIYGPSANDDERQDDGHDDDNFVLVTWLNAATQETMQSYYSIKWLYQCRHDHAALEERRGATVVAPSLALSLTRSPREFDMHDIINSSYSEEVSAAAPMSVHEETLFELLHAIFQDGAVLIRNAPASLQQEHYDGEHTVTKLANLLAGGTSHGHLYGETFDVITRVNANNIAYTSEALVPHQDLAYYQSPPGLQLLHCVANNSDTVVGGESTLVDVMAAATELQRLAPDLLERLSTVEATFIKQRHNADMVYRGPYITVDSAQNIVGVRWSPPFEGPVFAESDRMQDFFVAKCALELMLDNAIPSNANFEFHGGSICLDDELQQTLRKYAHSYTWEQRLQPGDVLVFNNQRMLHGRRGFRLTSDAKDGDRHLIGCYTNMEETLNWYRLLRRTRLTDRELTFHRNAGNNSGGG